MIGLIQRVTEAAVRVDNAVIGEIGPGLLALIGIEKEDSSSVLQRLLDKMLSYRVFSDEKGRMNHSLVQSGGGLLLVPQFTLVADTEQGLRPGFSNGAKPDVAQALYDELVGYSRMSHHTVESGKFGADMKISLVNDGPVTFWLQVQKH